jgi:hypothetical protein
MKKIVKYKIKFHFLSINKLKELEIDKIRKEKIMEDQVWVVWVDYSLSRK